MDTMSIRARGTSAHPMTRDEQAAAAAGRDVEQIIANIDAGHTMAGMPLTDADKAAIRRVDRGETTAEQERQQILTEIANANDRA